MTCFFSSPLTSYGVQVIAGSENFTSDRYFLKVPTKASLLALANSIHYTIPRFSSFDMGQLVKIRRHRCK